MNQWVEKSSYKNELPIDNAKRFVTKDGYTYNLCHFWNNFEIGSFKLFRDEKYLSYFDHLDKTGGFFYERWGDAPVHTLYVALMLQKNQIIRFENIGYGHDIVYNAPKNVSIKCKTKINFNPDKWCVELFDQLQNN